MNRDQDGALMGAETLEGSAGTPARRATWKRVFFWGLCCVLVLALLAALFVFISYKTVQHFYATAPNPVLVYEVDKAVRASIFEWVPVEVEVDEAIPVKLSKVLEVEIPVHEKVDVWIDDDFIVPVDTTLSIPIDQEVYVETEVPVEVQIPLDGFWVRTSLLGLADLSLPVSGSLPVKTTIPIRRPIHIKTVADVKIQKEVAVHVKKRLTLPLDLDLDVKLPIEGVFDVRFTKDFEVKSRLPQEIPVGVRLRLTLSKNGIVTAE